MSRPVGLPRRLNLVGEMWEGDSLANHPKFHLFLENFRVFIEDIRDNDQPTYDRLADLWDEVKSGR